MKFNIKHHVKVKLTDAGVAELKSQHEDLQIFAPSIGDFSPPKKDKQGYSEFQLWVLMSKFGEKMINGGDLMFETEIIIPDKS
ncbi:SOS regulatory protein [Pantoea phage PdC23]|uniref:SOS regulatory protein n=1 Tax=Pantoea phage PdC23 TaxID=2894356 RepID=A0AAE9C8D7_9CAUD|nr:SOS regulatory protein [Pantoea phage PdC23]UGC97769.1 SOS regulatory protein [Pantoea phage PdC23]